MVKETKVSRESWDRAVSRKGLLLQPVPRAGLFPGALYLGGSRGQNFETKSKNNKEDNFWNN